MHTGHLVHETELRTGKSFIKITCLWHLFLFVFFIGDKKARRNQRRLTFVFRYLCFRASPVSTRIEGTLAIATKRKQLKSVRSCLSIQVAYKCSSERRCQK